VSESGGVSRGIGLMLLGCFLLAAMDAGSKYLAQHYPVPQILWVRFSSLVVIAAWLAARRGGIAGLITRHIWLQSLRSLILVAEIGLFITSITVLRLADAHAIFAIAPLIVTALSVPLLGEHVGIRRWSAVAVAFVGVLIVLRPGLGVMHPMAFLVLICAFLFSLYQILTRVVSRNDAPETTLFYTALIGGIGLSLIVPFHWRTPDPTGWAILGLVTLLSASGHFAFIKALQLAPASVLQPFSYTILLWATVVGFMIFGNLPDWPTVLGALIITLSGLYTFARERRLASQGPESE
jgi:drug/metabolite transporter (DMT)-like permease